MLQDIPFLYPLRSIVRQQLAAFFESTEINAILLEAEEDNPAAQFIVAGALESAGQHEAAFKWYRRSAQHGYFPALERLRRDATDAA